MMNLRSVITLSVLFLITVCTSHAQQSEHAVLENGTMWTFDNPPVEYFSETYDFSPDGEWFDDVRMSALRFANHCSASFISAEGLVMTNFHCGIDAVQEVTREGEDLRRDGFYAATAADERRVPDLFVEQLVGIEDVTEEVIGAMASAEDASAAMELRAKAIAEIETRMSEAPVRCQVVTFYNGARFSAYLYKRYDDVRLVFSSELGFAFFGGIYDFWAYPRYSFDCDLFRVYENGEPMKPEHYFHWSEKGAAPGEAIFVVGNPGRTGRLVTADILEFERDHRVPFVVDLLTDAMEEMKEQIRSNPESAGEKFDQYFGIVNSQEAYAGRLIGLRDNELIERRRAFDERSREAVRSDPDLEKKYGTLWDDIRALTTKQKALAPDLYALRTSGLGNSAYIVRASAIVTWIEQTALPEEQRSKSYRGEAAELQRRQLLRPLESDPVTDERGFTQQLQRMQNILGANDPLMQQALQGSDPATAAKRMLSETKLTDTEAIKSLLDNGDLEACADPFIRLARVMNTRGAKAATANAPLAAELEHKRQMLGSALYAIYGNAIPPDATFTLRISDGIVDGYEYNGTVAPSYTTFYGMYDRYHSFDDDPGRSWDAMMNGNAWELPPRWKNPPASFDLSTPINFVSTCDIIGGNSGSPVINKNKEIIGLAFDGNIESLPGEFIFAPDKANRTISVHSQGIIESLRHIYNATRIVEEIERSR
ncbi:MAG: hypothetical protein C0600_03170 [Ignavibacteria bacterium]|nr:MAG: hypothetical protein C0600_03170 [Ignavibacteria bacterium]